MEQFHEKVIILLGVTVKESGREGEERRTACEKSISALVPTKGR